MIKYISTRGEAPILNFSNAVMTGLARDGGLYLPEEYPVFSPQKIRALRGKSYSEIAKEILWPFVKGEIDRIIFENMIDEAYSTFSHKATCPLVQIGPNEFVLELFHGPTLAFKDIAMQLLSRLMQHILKQNKQHATIVGATSGDTGGAAIEAFRHANATDVFILFPKGRVSPRQQKQMTSHEEKNIHALAIEGNFDDCQALVKQLFNDHTFRDKINLSGVNSINWARIMAQIVYYFSAAIALGAPDRAVSFTVPTGNFGDIFAGFVASRMGLPIAKLVIATNDNDILVRTLNSHIYQIQSLIATSSPSMDIQVSSNFERLIFEANDRDPLIVRNAMECLRQSGQFTLSTKSLEKIKTIFSAGCATIPQTAETIKQVFEENQYLVDPHTAVAIKVAREHNQTYIPMIVLSTAHPAKFHEAVYNACTIEPAIPERLQKILNKEEKYTILPNDIDKLKEHILKNISNTQSQ